MGKTFSQLPSKILDIRDPWAAFQFDCAVLTAGLQFEAENKPKSRRPQNNGGRRSNFSEPSLTTADIPHNESEFRSIKSLGTPRKMKVPASGVW